MEPHIKQGSRAVRWGRTMTDDERLDLIRARWESPEHLSDAQTARGDVLFLLEYVDGIHRRLHRLSESLAEQNTLHQLRMSKYLASQWG